MEKGGASQLRQYEKETPKFLTIPASAVSRFSTHLFRTVPV